MTGKRAKPGLIAATHTTDAIVLLRSDMETVAGLFRQLENCRSAAEKKPIVKQICVALSVRAQLEEEILYPALTRALNDRDLLYRSHLQRTALRALIAEVEDIEPDDDYDTNLAMISDHVRGHVDEQNAILPRTRDSRIDLHELGTRLATRKNQILAGLSDYGGWD